ncbi:MAG TPA: FAD-dependent oxidoreductase [Leptolyngbyaceae cyanobacterium]
MVHSPLFRKLIRTFQQAHLANLQAQGVDPSPVKRSTDWTRRRFVRTAALAGGSAIATRTLAHSKVAWGNQSPRIAIVGGGIAGLHAAYQLKKAGLQAIVHEARTRLGGRMQTVTGAVGPGLVSEVGGQLINTDHLDMLALVEDFGLTLFDRAEDAAQSPFPETAFYFGGQHRSEAEVAEKLRPLARQIAADAIRLNANYDRVAPEFDHLSVTQYLDLNADKITDPFIRRLMEETIRTEYGVEPSQSSALQLLFNLPLVKGDTVQVLGASDEVYVVKGGVSQIIEGLANALTGQIRLGMQLTKLTLQGSGYQLTFGNTQVEADYVILAIPPTVLRQVDLQVTLPAKLKKFIQEVNLGANEKLLAGFNQKVWRQSNGFVGEVWTDLGFSEAWEGSQAQTERKEGELTFFFGGNPVKALQVGSASTQGKRWVQQINAIIPGAQAASNNQFLRTAWTQDPLTQGGYTSFKPGQLTEFSNYFYIESNSPQGRQDVAVGNLIFAGEHFSDAFYGFMNGAAETGRLAAEVILRNLQGQKTDSKTTLEPTVKTHRSRINQSVHTSGLVREEP